MINYYMTTIQFEMSWLCMHYSYSMCLQYIVELLVSCCKYVHTQDKHHGQTNFSRSLSPTAHWTILPLSSLPLSPLPPTHLHSLQPTFAPPQFIPPSLPCSSHSLSSTLNSFLLKIRWTKFFKSYGLNSNRRSTASSSAKIWSMGVWGWKRGCVKVKVCVWGWKCWGSGGVSHDSEAHIEYLSHIINGPLCIYACRQGGFLSPSPPLPQHTHTHTYTHLHTNLSTSWSCWAQIPWHFGWVQSLAWAPPEIALALIVQTWTDRRGSPEWVQLHCGHHRTPGRFSSTVHWKGSVWEREREGERGGLILNIILKATWQFISWYSRHVLFGISLY